VDFYVDLSFFDCGFFRRLTLDKKEQSLVGSVM